MKSISRASLRSWAWLATAALLQTGFGYAQNAPSGDVMQLFRQMGNGQQQQILQQLGLGGEGQGTAPGETNSGGGQSARQEDLEAEALRRQKEARRKLDERLQILHPQDWIAVEVDVVPLPPRPTDTTEALYDALTAGTAGTAASAAFQQQLAGVNATQAVSQANPAQLQQLQQIQQYQQGLATQGLSGFAPQLGYPGYPTQPGYYANPSYYGSGGYAPTTPGCHGSPPNTTYSGYFGGQGYPGTYENPNYYPGASGYGGNSGYPGNPGYPGLENGTGTGMIQQQLPFQGGWQYGPPNLLLQPDVMRQAQLAALICTKNPYQLTADGVLSLPGFEGIRLAGLTDVQATLRLELDPALRGLYFRVTKLPLAKTGVEGLEPFGYDLFSNAPSTFAPVTNVPLPADYVLGPGDQLEIQLYGNRNNTLMLRVSRNGQINFPELGPINVAGERFLTAKENIESRVARQMIGVKADVSMGQTRAIRVFVLGEAQAPGSYAVSGLSTMTSALYAAGGIKSVGSLRDVQLKRQGQIVRHLDLYDMLIRGDTTDDARLLPGDVIFIPSVGPTVSIEGQVHRPAIYELKRGTSVADLLQLAGGLTPDAESSTAWVTRINDHQQRIVLAIDLDTPAARTFQLQNGDVLRVMKLLPQLDSGIVLEGHLYSPGSVAYRPGMRLSDVIHSVDELEPNADLHYVLIRRELPPDRRIVALSADLAAALAAPGGRADVKLMPRDRVMVFDLSSGRDRVIQPLIEELRLQAHFDRPTQVVEVEGRVKVPGEYPLEPGMRISDLLRAGGSLSDAAYGGTAELARYNIVNGNERQTQLIPVDLAAVMRGDPTANIKLQPFDSLSVKQLSLWGEQEQVTLSGEVRFPGVYTIKDGETLKSVLLRAGGLTEFAYPQGSVFTRVQLRYREQDEINSLAQRTQSDLAALALQGIAAGGQLGASAAASAANPTATLQLGQSLLAQLRGGRAIGRLVIDIPQLMREPIGSADDVILRNGDQLIVPKYEQEVSVIGEVQSTTSHLYRRNFSLDDYIAQSGGFTQRADRRRVYVVRANGSVVSQGSAFWFRSPSVQIRPGDTIVVPMNVSRLPTLLEWQAITTTLYNIAVGAATLKYIGVI
jgi:polysaccharide biosynthesis/export protein